MLYRAVERSGTSSGLAAQIARKAWNCKSAYYYRTDKARVSPRKEKDGERGALMLFLSKMQRYRRIKAALERAGRVISEKVIRRLMKALGLKVKGKRTWKCSSHAGEISPPAVKGFRRVTGTQEMPIS